MIKKLLFIAFLMSTMILTLSAIELNSIEGKILKGNNKRIAILYTKLPVLKSGGKYEISFKIKKSPDVKQAFLSIFKYLSSEEQAEFGRKIYMNKLPINVPADGRWHKYRATFSIEKIKGMNEGLKIGLYNNNAPPTATVELSEVIIKHVSLMERKKFVEIKLLKLLKRLPQKNHKIARWISNIPEVFSEELSGKDFPDKLAEKLSDKITEAQSFQIGKVVYLFNSKMAIALKINPLTLISLYGFDDNKEFINKSTSSLFRVQWEDFKNSKTFSIAENFSFSVHEKELNNKGRELVFEGKSAKDKLFIRVSVKLPSYTSSSLWTAELHSEKEKHHLEINFPYVSGLGNLSTANTSDKFVCGSRLFEDPDKYIKNYLQYRPAIWLMAYYGPGGGLYLNPRDGLQYYKAMGFEKHDFYFRAYIKNHAPALTKNYTIPYQIEIAPFSGDWQVAAKSYRNWAIKQSWCSQGTIEERKDLYDSFKYNAFAIWFHVGPVQSFEVSIKAKDYFELPFTALDYGYFRYYYNDNEPFSFPPKQGTVEFLKRMQEEKIPTMDYLNATIWDTDTPEWEKYDGEKNTIMKKNGKRLYHRYAKFSQSFGSPCPSSKVFEDLICNEVLKRTKAGYTGQYLDQVGAIFPYQCYDIKHKHVAGPSNERIKGYSKILKRILEENRKINPEFTMMTEGLQENYIDLIASRFQPFQNHNSVYIKAPRKIDSQLRGRYGSVSIPCFEYVYHQYIVIIGGMLFPRQSQFAIHQSTAFIWGHKFMLNWQGAPWGAVLNEAPANMAFLRKLAKIRIIANKFIIFGAMEKIIEVDAKEVETLWKSYNDRRLIGKSVNKAVLASIWKASDGNLGIALANHTKEEQAYSIKIRPREYGFDVKDFKLESLTGKDSNFSFKRTDTGTVEIKGKLFPLDAELIEIVAAGSQSGRKQGLARFKSLQKQMQQSSNKKFRHKNFNFAKTLFADLPFEEEVKVSGNKRNEISINRAHVYHISSGEYSIKIKLSAKDASKAEPGLLTIIELPPEIAVVSPEKKEFKLRKVASQTVDIKINVKNIKSSTSRDLRLQIKSDNGKILQEITVKFYLTMKRSEKQEGKGDYRKHT